MLTLREAREATRAKADKAGCRGASAAPMEAADRMRIYRAQNVAAGRGGPWDRRLTPRQVRRLNKKAPYPLGATTR